MQIGEQLGTDWSRFEVSKVELEVGAFLSGFRALCSPKTYAAYLFDCFWFSSSLYGGSRSVFSADESNSTGQLRVDSK